MIAEIGSNGKRHYILSVSNMACLNISLIVFCGILHTGSVNFWTFEGVAHHSEV